MKDILYSIRRLHGRLHEWRENELPYYIERFRNPTAVYLVLTPEHGNLGDQAIACAEIEMLNELGIPFIEYSWNQLKKMESKDCLHVMNGRPILIHGGGYLGTLWFIAEDMLRNIISENQDSPIVAFPNTLFYEDSEWGRQEFERSVQIYNAHRKLKLFAREKTSYEIMKSAYKDVALAPDMVLGMNQCESDGMRSGCILCLRSDKERTRSEETERVIRQQTKALFGENTTDLDMVVNHAVKPNERGTVLEKQFSAFRRAELVITDRLHGMIFCAITGTPCIVIDSKSPKVRGCYEWIKDLPYIRFCDDVTQIEAIFHEIPAQNWKYDPSKLQTFYEPLTKALLAIRG